jgi:DNA-binding winged helix-turn-helix (wHTH) protein
MGEGQYGNSTIRFGDYEVDRCSGELRKRGVRIKLQEQPFKVLVTLLEHPGEVVTREELQKRIWPGESYGDFDHAVNVAVAKLRDALSDSVLVPRFIETLHRRGYRFVGAVESKGLGISAEPIAQPPARSSFRIRREAALLLGLAAILVLSTTVWLIVASRKPARPVTQRILTASSLDDAAETPFIFPDGKYVAFATAKGIFLQKIESGELRQLAKDGNAIVGWFADGDRLLLSDCRKRIVCELYALSLTSGARQELLDGVGGDSSLSHNGLTIAYIKPSPGAGNYGWLTLTEKTAEKQLNSRVGKSFSESVGLQTTLSSCYSDTAYAYPRTRSCWKLAICKGDSHPHWWKIVACRFKAHPDSVGRGMVAFSIHC